MLSPKIQRKSMWPARGTMPACMNMAGKNVTHPSPAVIRAGIRAQSPRSTSAARGSLCASQVSRNTVTFAAISAPVTHGMRREGLWSRTGIMALLQSSRQERVDRQCRIPLEVQARSLPEPCHTLGFGRCPDGLARRYSRYSSIHQAPASTWTASACAWRCRYGGRLQKFDDLAVARLVEISVMIADSVEGLGRGQAD